MEEMRIINTVNEISAVLLGTSVEDFDQNLFTSMGRLGESLKMDRVYIWHNHMEGDELYCTQIHEWSGNAEPQQGNELTVSVPFPADWYPNLSADLCVNGVVASFPEYEREHLQAQGIVSILVVPIFLYNEFWGFMGFDDCQKERIFTDAEEAVLRTAGLLFGHAWVRNEMTLDLVKAKEEALASAKAKTDFLANMSHEIRTPINAIMGMAEIARKSEDKEQVEECLERIKTASQQLLSIINDVLDMSKITAGKMTLSHKPFKLREVIQNLEDIVAAQVAEKNQTFDVRFYGEFAPVLIGDEVRLTQVLLNLLSNAVKFTGEGGAIGLTIEVSERQEGREKYQFVVADNGIGINADRIDVLFSEFEQEDQSTSREYGGTGLGLSISKGIAAEMNGQIEVESEQGKGSRFTVTVWLETGAEEQMDKPEKEPEVEKTASYDFSGKRALLVEDMEINRQIVTAMLTGYGLEIEIAVNGQEAVEKMAAAPEHYDLIFMDLQMPVMDGYEATKRIRQGDSQQSRQIPIIAMTANAFAEDAKRCLEAGMNSHIAKPIDFEKLLLTIAQYL
ncbi:response regulator [Lachnospiraceae bacterium OttesenSCG-928-J05]|nr:response regulator [Lachnospiraceae bacterium OttesenSCG-928-J05]